MANMANTNLIQGLNIQLNIHGIRSANKGDELIQLILNSSPQIDVICLQETWVTNKLLNKHFKYNIPGYESYFTNKIDNK